jgi:hypothetical protein
MKLILIINILLNGKRLHKSNFRKSKTGISESKKILNVPKIWDCGKIKFEMIK